MLILLLWETYLIIFFHQTAPLHKLE